MDAALLLLFNEVLIPPVVWSTRHVDSYFEVRPLPIPLSWWTERWRQLWLPPTSSSHQPFCPWPTLWPSYLVSS